MQINVLEYLENSVKKYPNKVAFVDSVNKYTFKQFNNCAKSIATGISTNFSFTNRPIVVFVDRNVESLICFMAVLYSGNFYVPLDNKMPKQRLKSILDKVNPELIICSKKDENVVSDFEFSTICYEDYMKFNIDEERLLQNRKKILDVDPAYIIFTSGSTGTPKGIVISHKSVIDLTEWLTNTFNFSKKDILVSLFRIVFL